MGGRGRPPVEQAAGMVQKNENSGCMRKNLTEKTAQKISPIRKYLKKIFKKNYLQFFFMDGIVYLWMLNTIYLWIYALELNGGDIMKKTQLQQIVEANKKCRTTTLQRYVDDLERITQERERTKGMYFWHPSDSASGRRYNENKRNIGIDIKMKGLTVHYDRNYNESCQYVYASDKLWADEADSFTLSDIKKLVVSFKEIMAKRTSVIKPSTPEQEV